MQPQPLLRIFANPAFNHRRYRLRCPGDIDPAFGVADGLYLLGQLGAKPMAGQAHHFRGYAPQKLPYAIDRYTNEAKRLYGVIDRRLAQSAWLGGKAYSIADIATFPWLRSWERQGVVLDEYKHLAKWFHRIEERPAVQRGVQVLADLRKPITDEKAREVLFGSTQYQRR